MKSIEDSLKKFLAGTNLSRVLLILLLLFFGLSLRICHFSQVMSSDIHKDLYGDEFWYHLWGQEIASGNIIGDRVFFSSPLYAYFLGAIYAVFGPEVPVVKCIQHMIGLLTTLLIYLIARRLFTERVALACLLVSLSYKMFYYYESLLLKTTLSIFTIVLMFYLVLIASEKRHLKFWLLAGLANGLGSLNRENYLLFIPFVMFWITWFFRDVSLKRRGQYVLSFMVGAGLMIAPVTLRNYVVSGGDWVLITFQGGQNFYIGNNENNTTGTYVIADWLRVPTLKYEETDYAAEAERESGHPLRPSEVSTFWFHKTFDYIRHNKAQFVRMLFKKLLLFLNYYEMPDNLNFYYLKNYSFILNSPLPNFRIMAPLGLTGLIFLARRRHKGVRLMGLYVLCYALAMVAFFIFSRYRIPLAPFFIMSGVYFLFKLYEWFRTDQLKQLALGLVILAGFGVAVNRDIGTYGDLPQKSEAQFYYDNAGKLYQAGQAKQSLKWYARAVERENKNITFILDYGLVLLEQQKYDEALAQFNRIIQIDPNNAEAYLNIGKLYDAQQQPYLAIEAYKKANDLNPGNANALSNLGLIYQGLNRVDEAIALHLEAITAQPDYWPARYNLALAYMSQQPELALVQLQAILEKDPQNSYALDLMKQLEASPAANEQAVDAVPSEAPEPTPAKDPADPAPAPVVEPTNGQPEPDPALPEPAPAEAPEPPPSEESVAAPVAEPSASQSLNFAAFSR